MHTVGEKASMTSARRPRACRRRPLVMFRTMRFATLARASATVWPTCTPNRRAVSFTAEITSTSLASPLVSAVSMMATARGELDETSWTSSHGRSGKSTEAIRRAATMARYPETAFAVSAKGGSSDDGGLVQAMWRGLECGRISLWRHEPRGSRALRFRARCASLPGGRAGRAASSLVSKKRVVGVFSMAKASRRAAFAHACIDSKW